MAAPPLSGQVVTSASAQQLASPAQGSSPTVWMLKSSVNNTSTFYIGAAGVTTATGFPIDPGDELTFDRRLVPGVVFDLNPSDVYVVGSGAVAAWLALR